MIKRLQILSLLSAVGIIASAAPLTPAESLSRLTTKTDSPVSLRSRKDVKLLRTFTNADDVPGIYMFRSGNRCLFLSADDVAAPLLGYMDIPENANPDASELAPQLIKWLESYTSQIDYAVANGMAPYSSEQTRAESPLKVISPMLTTKWDQGEPYNLQCPLVSGQRSVTGCVATAMAQVMNYFKYPAKGKGSVSYTTSSYKQSLSMNFSEVSFDWNNMLDQYKDGNYNTTQGAAVASLMKACGYSVEMNYTPVESGAYSFNVAPALKNYFSYDKGTHYLTRNFFSPAEWKEMIYDNLRNVGPVIYDGVSAGGGGHCFVCDGYDGVGYFHFNWGWDGMSDGYFLLEALNPPALGIGGGGGGFNFDQGAVFGAQPPKEGTVEFSNYLQQSGSLTATVTGTKLEFDTTGKDEYKWINISCPAFTARFVSIVENLETGEINAYPAAEELDFKPMRYYPNYRPALSLQNLPVGKYKITLATQQVEEGNYLRAVPVYCDYLENNYIYVSYDGDKYDVELPKVKNISIPTVRLESPLYPSNTVRMVVTATNDLDMEVSKAVTPMLYYQGRQAFQGCSSIITVPAKSTVEIEIYSDFQTLVGAPSMMEDRTMILRILDSEIGVSGLYAGQETVTMHANPGKTNFTINSVTVDAPVNEKGEYMMSIGEPLRFTADIALTSGYFSNPVYMMIYANESQVGNMLMAQSIGESLTIIEEGQQYQFNGELTFPQGESEKSYICRLGYHSNGKYSPIMEKFKYAQFKFVMPDLSGINEIEDDNTAKTEYYNLQGLLMESPRKGELVIVKKGNKTSKVIW
ncbi:MAG: C10 family peptidase [Muribaculaceae bacterium]|nr:C10 family peptidase [Muribaculaceae bacterium]